MLKDDSKTVPTATTGMAYTDFSGFSKENLIDFSGVLLNVTWMVFLFAVATALLITTTEYVKNTKAKRILDEELFQKFKEYSTTLHRINTDLDNLGRKIREIEKRRY